MIGLVSGWHRRNWQGRSKVEKVDAYSHLTLYFLSWFLLLTWGVLPMIAETLEHLGWPLVLGWGVVAGNAAQCALANRLLRPALTAYLRKQELPTRRLMPTLVAQCVSLALLVALQAVAGSHVLGIGFLLMLTPIPLGLSYCLLVPVRTFLIRFAVLAAVLFAAFAAVGTHGAELFGTVPLVLAGSGLFILLTARPCAWTLSVMWEAEHTRDVRARLAVAEERLRFARDLHDVLGRNLAVIALKSELAVQLARRGRPEAVDQMTEVQRIAQDSQREVREVVRGYREADLATELMGAQGVLTAAGIHCEVSGSTTGLPVAVQSALGWVVREATTNVLRHGDAAHCAVRLTTAATAVVLTIENDGLPTCGPAPGDAASADAAPGGSGLKGLRERLTEVGGVLTAGAVDETCFRLRAEIPLGKAGRAGHEGQRPTRRSHTSQERRTA